MLSEDPIKAGLNWYVYCNNNPVMFIDPWGLIPSELDGALMLENLPNVTTQYLYETSYEKRDVIGYGWRLYNILATHANNKARVGVYSRPDPYNPGKTEFTIAFSGTQNANDWDNNGLQLVGLSPDMIKSIDLAIDFVNTWAKTGCDITMVGHSKGGAEAICAAIMTNRNCLTYNTMIPDLLPTLPNTLLISAFAFSYTKKMTHFVVGSEPLSPLSSRLNWGIPTRFGNAPVNSQVVYLKPPMPSVLTIGLFMLHPIVGMAVFSFNNHSVSTAVKALQQAGYKNAVIFNSVR